MLYGHLLMGKSVRPLLLGKTREELLVFIKEQLKQREPYYSQARHILNVDLMDNYDKIKISVQNVRQLLGI